MKFPHDVVAITGASSGIGQELALQLGRLGCKVGLMARRQERLETIAEQVEDEGGKACSFVTDVSDYENVKAGIDHTRKTFGPIDCVIANAGIGQPVEARNFDPKVTESIMRVNVVGMANVFYAALPEMLERKKGHLVSIASLASYQGMPLDGGYSGSKAAMRTHSESMRIELRGSGVNVSCICPGFIRTPMTDKNEFDMPFLVEVDTACRKIIRAIAKRRKVYNFPWQLWWLIKLAQRTPRWIYDPGVARSTRRAEEKKRKQHRSTEHPDSE